MAKNKKKKEEEEYKTEQKVPRTMERTFRGTNVIEKPAFPTPEEEIYSVTFKGMGETGQDETIFDKEQIAKMPENILKSQNVKVVTAAEHERLSKLTPMERYNERREQEYAQGEYGSFTAEELNARFQAEGKQPLETAPEEPLTATQKAAQMGAAPAVAVANLISRGLKVVGVDIGTITKEQFASTTIGKTLGLATLGMEAITAGAIGGYALSLLPSTIELGTLGAVGSARAVTAGAVVKTGIMSKLTSGAIVKLAIGGAAIGLIENRISNLETSVVNQRETLTLISSAVDAGAITRSEAMLMFDEVENSINTTDAAIQKTGIFSIRFRMGKGVEVQTRLEKARTQLMVERAKLAGI